MNYLQFLLNYGGAIIAGCVAVWTTRQGRKAAQKLAKQQAGHTREIEALKNQLAFSFARKSKFADAEYETLAGLWDRLSSFYNAVIRLHSDGFEYWEAFGNPAMLSLQKMPEHKLRLLIKKEKYPLSEIQIDFIMTSNPNQRVNLLRYEIFNSFIENCHNASKEFQEYYNRQSIYLDENLKEQFIENRNIGKKAVFILREVIGEHKKGKNEILAEANPFIEDFREHTDALEKIVHTKISPQETSTMKEEKR